MPSIDEISEYPKPSNDHSNIWNARSRSVDPNSAIAKNTHKHKKSSVTPMKPSDVYNTASAAIATYESNGSEEFLNILTQQNAMGSHTILSNDKNKRKSNFRSIEVASKVPSKNFAVGRAPLGYGGTPIFKRKPNG